MVEVPGWLVPAYVRSVQSAGSPQSKEALAEACHSLIERWSSPDRAYHGLQHVIELLTRLETLLPETHEPSLVRLAAWYHGIVFSTAEEDAYTKKGGENIGASATMAETHLLELDVDQTKAHRVAELVRGMKPTDTKTTTETAQFQAFDVDELALRDAHLGTLAVEPQRYKRYLELVREEYAHIPRLAFLTTRRDIVSRLLARRQLFVTPLARQWDARARENLEAELERLGRMIAEYEASAAQTNSERAAFAGAAGDAAGVNTAPENTGTARTHAPILGADGAHNSDADSGAPQPVSHGSSDEPLDTTSQPAAEREAASDTMSTGAASHPVAGPAVASGSLSEADTTARSAAPQDIHAPLNPARAHTSSSASAHSPAEPTDITAALLAASAEADEAERLQAEKEAEAEAKRQLEVACYAAFKEKDTLSSMEACHELVDPGLPEREATTAEERKKRRREEVAAELRRRIEERHRAACAAKEARDAAQTNAPLGTDQGDAAAAPTPPPPAHEADTAGRIDSTSQDAPSSTKPQGDAPLPFVASVPGFPSKEQVEFFSQFGSADEAYVPSDSWPASEGTPDWAEALPGTRAYSGASAQSAPTPASAGDSINDHAPHGDEVTPAGIMAPAPPDVSTTTDIPVVRVDEHDSTADSATATATSPSTGMPPSEPVAPAQAAAHGKAARPTRDQDAPPPHLTRDPEEDAEPSVLSDTPVHGMEREPEI
ncbi:hypothetical protein I6E29_06825 [Arcanobacterium haemolyticum]|nr:hypothetical protein [Arcanobacterium haemolyticum]